MKAFEKKNVKPSVYVFLFIFLLVVFTNTVAQKTDNALAQHGIKIAAVSPDSSLIIANKLLKPGKNTDAHIKALAYYGIGEGNYYKQLYDSALTAYKQALFFFIKTNDTSYLASTYNNIGLIYFFKADYGKSLDAYLASLALEEKKNNLLGVAKSHQNIGLIYSRWGRREQELEHLLIALNIYKQLKDTNSIANTETNLGVTYVHQDQYEKALEHYQNGLKLFKKINDQSGIASVMLNIGHLYFYKKDFDKSSYYFLNAANRFKKIKNKRGLIHAYSALGKMYSQKKNYKEAIKYFFASEKLNTEMGFKEAQLNNLENLYKLYKTTNDFKNANTILEKIVSLKDTIFDQEKFTKLAEMEKKFNVEKSRQEMLLYKTKNEKQKLLLTGTVVFFIFIIINLSVLIKNNKLKEKHKRLILEQKALRTQMNPHFIFNTLSAIQCMVFDNHSKEATDYLADFSKLIRKVLEYSREEKITLKQEKDLLMEYFNLQNRRFNNKIMFNIIWDQNINEEKTLIPPMLAQPFIENAIEHGQLNEMDDGVITLTYKKENNRLQLSIEDNGIGIQQSLNDHHKKGLAMEITRERINLFNGNAGNAYFVFDTKDLAEENRQGTRITFSIPYEEST
ncbi:MAG: tetratricopeptide repeat protein [Chlorobi bacterium]|nr:tetratricopeptide repeat protein [Chlorobiota bacterium]